MQTLAGLGSVSYYGVCQNYPRQMGAVLATQRRGSTSGTGRGEYPQNLASALFEVLEHGVCEALAHEIASGRLSANDDETNSRELIEQVPVSERALSVSGGAAAGNRGRIPDQRGCRRTRRTSSDAANHRSLGKAPGYDLGRALRH